MPRIVPIGIYHIAGTQIDRAEVQKWLDRIGVKEYKIPSEDAATDPALIIALAAKRCYMSFEAGLNPNVTKVRADLTEYLDNVLKQKHGSVLEHATHSYAIEGVSRVFTGEMNRHRAGWALSEGSMRYIRYSPDFDEAGEPLPDSGIPYWLPDTITEKPDDDPDLADRKRRHRIVMDRAFRQMEVNYQELLDIWEMEDTNRLFAYKKIVTSCCRRIIGMGVGTGGVWTGNIRALRHVISMRADEGAEEEICHVFSRVAKDLMEREPMLFADFEETKEGYWRPKYWKV